MMSKPRIIKKYELLDEAIMEQIRVTYPNGFDKHLVIFKNHKGELISALPFETEDFYFMIRMTRSKAKDIAEGYDDDDDDNEEESMDIEDEIDKHLKNEEADVKEENE